MTEQSPQVGIFWILKGEIIRDSVPVSQGEEYGNCVNGLSDHCTFWPKIQRTRPETRHYGYDQVPRGRVVYRIPDNTFLVYGSERFVRSEDQKRLVLSAFDLGAATIMFLVGRHYAPIPGMIDD